MLVTKTVPKEHNIPVRGDVMASIPVYQVVIHPNEKDEAPGYWAECVSLDGCFTIGRTVQETQVNMYEAVSLTLSVEFPDVREYSLDFRMAHE